jgi:hypothetical protein
MWLDIRAGPVSWGPRYYGEGAVHDAIVPWIHNYNPVNDSQRRDVRIIIILIASSFSPHSG